MHTRHVYTTRAGTPVPCRTSPVYFSIADFPVLQAPREGAIPGSKEPIFCDHAQDFGLPRGRGNNIIHASQKTGGLCRFERSAPEFAACHLCISCTKSPDQAANRIATLRPYPLRPLNYALASSDSVTFEKTTRTIESKGTSAARRTM